MKKSLILLTFILSSCGLIFLEDDGPLKAAKGGAITLPLGTEIEISLPITGGSGSYQTTLLEGTLPSGTELREDGVLTGFATQGLFGQSILVRVKDKFLAHRFADLRFTFQDQGFHWSFYIYMAADSNLSSYASLNMDQLEAVDLTGTGIQIIVLQDLLGDNNTRVFRLRNDLKTDISDEFPLLQGGVTELNTGDPATLSGFLDFAESQYPADNTFLVMWDHGYGWRSNGGEAPPPPNRALAVDDTHGGDMLLTREFGQALSGRQYSVIGFDLCFGMMIEPLFEIRQNALYAVGSQEVIPGPGWNYTLMLNKFIDSNRTPVALAQAVLDAYSEYYSLEPSLTFSMVDLRLMETVNQSFNVFSQALAQAVSMNSALRNTVRDIFQNQAEDIYELGGDLAIDIRHMAQLILDQTDGVDVYAQNLIGNLDSMIVANWAQETGFNTNATGLSIHLFPIDSQGEKLPWDPAYYQDYAGTDAPSFISQSSWPPTSSGEGLLGELF